MSPQVTFVDLRPTYADECGDLRPQYTLDRLHLNGDRYLAGCACFDRLLPEFDRWVGLLLSIRLKNREQIQSRGPYPEGLWHEPQWI